MSGTGREFPARPIVGIGAVVLSERGVLLIQRGKPPRVGSWSLPGGAQKIGETVYEAARREVMEETNLEIDILGLIDVADLIHRTDDDRVEYHYTLIDVVATADPDVPPVAGGDVMDTRWVPLDGLAPYKLWDETVRFIDMANEILRTKKADR